MANVSTTFLPADWKPGNPIPEDGTSTSSPTVTIGESQATSAGDQPAVPVFSQGQVNQILGSQDDAVQQAATSPGVGAGTTGDAATSINSADNPTPTGATAQQVINRAFSTSTNSQIITQPNVLDQYASYTYSISWYLLSQSQYNTLYDTKQVNTTGWQLLMQSGGIPVGNRSQYFPVDYYMDDLEIESVVPLHGTNMINSATDIKFKVTEPNGITLIENLYKAVKSVSKNTPNPNYLTAQHCLIIQFYGYDSQGNLISPATGQYGANGQLSGKNPQSVIQKYYPCVITNITFRVANRAVEYSISAKPLVHFYNASSDRATIPFAFSLSGQTVAQLLVGNPVSAAGIAQFEPGARTSSPTPAAASTPPGAAPVVPPTLPSMVTGQDNPLATSSGMDYTPGNF
jgi:hypothetical protein